MAIRRIVRRALTAALATQAVACMPTSNDPDRPDPEPPTPVVEGLEAIVSLATPGQPVAAGVTLSLAAEAQLAVENCAGCAVQLAFALDGDTVCAFDGTERSPRLDLTFTAPAEAGQHAVRYAATLAGDCAEAERLARTGAILGHVAVMGAEPPPDENRAPEVQGIDVAPATFNTGCETVLEASARDPDGDALQLTWAVNGNPAGEGARLALPGGRARGVQVSVTARDTGGRADTERLSLTLPACEVPEGALVSVDGRSAFVQVPATSFDSARRAAARAGGHLATLTDQAQVDRVVEAFRGGWIGRWSPNQDGRFESITGEPGGFDAFCPGEPNNAGGSEWAVELWDIACLNDEAASRSRPAIVEFDLPGGPEDVSAGGAFERGAFDAGLQDRSVLRIERPMRVQVRVAAGGGGCDGVGDPMLAVRFGGDLVAQVDDADGSVCPAITFEAEPGVYDLVVSGFGGGALPSHHLWVTLDAEPAPAPEPVLPALQLVDGDGACPAGWEMAPVEVAEVFPREVCELLGSWYIVRLADGAAFDGPGYGCNLRRVEHEPLGQTLCARY